MLDGYGLINLLIIKDLIPLIILQRKLLTTEDLKHLIRTKLTPRFRMCILMKFFWWTEQSGKTEILKWTTKEFQNTAQPVQCWKYSRCISLSFRTPLLYSWIPRPDNAPATIATVTIAPYLRTDTPNGMCTLQPRLSRRQCSRDWAWRCVQQSWPTDCNLQCNYGIPTLRDSVSDTGRRRDGAIRHPKFAPERVSGFPYDARRPVSYSRAKKNA